MHSSIKSTDKEWLPKSSGTAVAKLKPDKNTKRPHLEIPEPDLILKINSDEENSLIQVDKSILYHLNHNQINEIKDMWDSIYEKNEIENYISHNKTPQVIPLVHILVANSSQTKFQRVLIIETLAKKVQFDWNDKFEEWTDHCDYKLNIFFLPKELFRKNDEIVNNGRRTILIEQWHEKGGVLLLDFSFFYWLLTVKNQISNTTNPKALLNTGTDLVIYDANLRQILRNNFPEITTKRQIILKS